MGKFSKILFFFIESTLHYSILKIIYTGYANSKRISNDMFLESLSMLHGSSSHFNDYEDPIYLWRRWKFKLEIDSLGI